jgi:nitronate monooxygenase
MLKTTFTRLLAVDLPIANAPIGTAASPELAAAVSNAGGLGMMAASFLTPPQVREAVRLARSLTDKPFAVNLLLEWPQEERLAICLEEGVPVISMFWGDPAPHVEAIHRAGARLIQSVGSVAEAVHARSVGADVILAQGWEAGGHVRGEVSTVALVPRIVDALPGTPVLAAGGIADGRGIAAALMLGAAGAALGTRFICSHESAVPELYRERVLAARETDTIFGETFDKGWPDSNMRTLLNSTMRAWVEAGRPPIGQRPGERDMVATNAAGVVVERYHVTQPALGMSGDLEALALYAGQGVGLVDDVRGAGEIVHRLCKETVAALRRAAELTG